jgi:Mg-chelatase subunit ChlD
VKRLIYDVPRWHLYLHRDARGLKSAAMDDSPLRQLEDELFDRLFAGASEPLPPGQEDATHRDWARGMHAAFEQLPSFSRLADQCRGDATAAAAAVEALIHDLRPELPNAEPSAPPPRRRVAQACEKAAQAVDDLHEAQAGFEHVDFSTPGMGSRPSTTEPDGGSRSLARRLAQDERLRRIAILAGRFKRILAAKRRERVRHGSDELSDVEQGADLTRLLPVELARMGHPGQRLAFLRDFTEGQCLQYQRIGKEVLGKGPLVACLDKSLSMEGSKDIWSTAVALALLDVASRERRPFALICFDDSIRYNTVVPAGGALPQDGLFVTCGGNTDIGLAVSTGLDVIAERPGRMRKADIVLITDGESSARTAPDLRARALQLGVTILGFGIGVPSLALSPWCDQSVAIESVSTLDEKTAEALAEL